MQTNRLFFRLGSAWLALAVCLGAFGAHALKESLSLAQMTTFETAVKYHFWTGLGLQIACLAKPKTLAPLWLLTAGSAVFSGSLYLLVFSGVRALGAVTPIGGLLLIAGWTSLAISGSGIDE